MKLTIKKEGLVAEYQGKFWGTQYEDGQCCAEGFGDIEHAEITTGEEVEFLAKPTDLTWTPRSDMPYNPYYEELKKATLRKIIVTTVFEISDLVKSG